MVPFKYDGRHRRLHVNCLHLDLGELQAHREGLFAHPLDTILCEMPDVTLTLRGCNLHRWIVGKSLPPAAPPYLDPMKKR
jgi:hypothetical protein